MMALRSSPTGLVAPPQSAIELEVLRIRELLGARQYGRALESSHALLLQVPQNRDVLYMLAVSQRFLGRVPAALATLDRLERIHPEYSRVFQERGHCLLASGDPGGAVAAFLRAVQLNAALPASWRALQVLFRSAGRTEDSQAAAGHVAKLASLPAAVVTASSLLADGEVHEAERVIRDYLRLHGDDVEGMRLLAQIAIQLDVLDDAEFLLESVLVFAPDYHPARCDYVRVLLQRHRHAKALEECAKLLESGPANRDFRVLYATTNVALGHYDQAIRVYRELAAETPNAPELHLSIAHALKTLGRQAEAVQSYKSAMQVAPHFGDAYWSLANLKTYRFTDAEVERMQREESSPAAALTDRYHVCFALGKAFDDRADYHRSFQYYASGNALKRGDIHYRPELIERTAQLQTSVITADFLARRRGMGCERFDPIFIVGMPRAGSTLLEQILASHSQVEGTMELADIPRLAQHLQGRVYDESAPRYPEVLRDLSSEQLRRYGEKYLADTEVYRTGKRFFIDKMPNNFRHIGLIHLILPNARIIDARRLAMPCCFSNFTQLFASGQEFTYSLEEIGRYYRSYVGLMRHWNAVLPGRILRVQHEDVIENFEVNVRRILEFCELPFESQCLEFYKTERSVRTASSEQVRRPINRDGLDRWRHFDPWLGPLRQALGDQAVG